MTCYAHFPKNKVFDADVGAYDDEVVRACREKMRMRRQVQAISIGAWIRSTGAAFKAARLARGHLIRSAWAKHCILAAVIAPRAPLSALFFRLGC